jgi:hypothetical protein
VFNDTIDQSRDFNGTNITYLGDSLLIDSNVNIQIASIGPFLFQVVKGALLQLPGFNDTNPQAAAILDDTSSAYNQTEAIMFLHQYFNWTDSVR